MMDTIGSIVDEEMSKAGITDRKTTGDLRTAILTNLNIDPSRLDKKVDRNIVDGFRETIRIAIRSAEVLTE